MPALVPPCSRALPGLSPAWQHGPGLSSPGTADTSQTWRIRHFGCRESHAKPISFYCRSAPSDHPLGLPLAAPAKRHAWGGAGVLGGAGCFGAGATATKGCLLIRRQLRARACLFKGYGSSVNNPLACFGGD